MDTFPSMVLQHISKHSKYAIRAVTLVLAILLLQITGCIPQLIAHRNQQVLDDTKELQKKTDVFLIKLQRACGKLEGNYENNTTQHDELKAAASSLQVAVDAIPKNTLTSAQVTLLRKNYASLDSIHRSGCNPLALESARRIINTHFTALITLEESKTAAK